VSDLCPIWAVGNSWRIQPYHPTLMTDRDSSELAGIDDETARALEAVARLHELAVQRFYERRRLEWRLAFTLWGGLGIAANALTEVQLTNDKKVIAIVALVVIVVAHFLWEWFYVRRGAEPDREEGYTLAALQRQTLGLPEGEKMKADGTPLLKTLPLIAYGWQVAITAALSTFVVLIIW